MNKTKKKIESRKGHSSLAFLRAPAITVICLLFFVFLFWLLLSERFSVLHQLTLEAIGPVQLFATRIGDGMGQVTDSFRGTASIRQERDLYMRRNTELLQQLSEFREAYSTYRYLQDQLRFREQEKFPVISARVIGGDSSFFTIVLDRGKRDDVLEGMVVLTPDGVVGQVVHVSENYCKVLLADAPSSAIDAVVQKSRVRGILKGTGEKGSGYLLEYVLKNVDVEVGDMIVTAGIGGVYSSGIALGKVSRVDKQQSGMFLKIEVQPTVDFQRLEYVLIDPTDRRKAMEDLGVESGPASFETMMKAREEAARRSSANQGR
ncbi:MAG TPA: rod shape-determining protein MreC [Desulfobulbaceae bacterium]|nr:rod shape-determining protein MreC [Desulfobulbaceae bacterium]